MTKTKALIVTAALLGSASGASAQSLIGNGLPSDAYGAYGPYAPTHGYAPAQRQPVAPRQARTHRLTHPAEY